MIIAHGLDGVVAAASELSLVDGTGGRLIYRGHWARQLAVQHTFEEVAHLLWYGQLPEAEALQSTTAALAAGRVLPAHVKTVIDGLPDQTGMMDVVRTAVSALGDVAWPPTAVQAIRCTAAIPSIIGHRLAHLEQREAVPPEDGLGHVAYLLHLLSGQPPAPQHVRALEAYLILTMEHGLNASAFAGRVVVSTQADMAAGLTAALAAMKGPLHGGAPSGVMDMLEQIGTVDAAEAWIRHQLETGQRLMGFGHRVYKTQDPRAMALREVVAGLVGQDAWFSLATQVEELAVRLLAEYKPQRALYTNVEYWAAAILRTVGIPKSLYTATFSVSRSVGWTAHMLEQAKQNRIIRPQSEYIGVIPATPGD